MFSSGVSKCRQNHLDHLGFCYIVIGYERVIRGLFRTLSNIYDIAFLWK